MYVHQRPSWEFMTVLQGSCTPLYESGQSSSLVSRRLWLFPPETAHGWVGHKRRPCRVAVFHFSRVPDLLEHVARSRGFLEVALSRDEIKKIDALAAEVTPYYERLTKKSLLVFEHALLTLSVISMAAHPEADAEVPTHVTLHKVESSIIWFMEHMAQRPKLSEISAAVHLSTRHLRRLFQRVHHCSPQEYFTRVRVQRASEMLTQTSLKQEVIAKECGFASVSDFSRVFRHYGQSTPENWRRSKTRR